MNGSRKIKEEFKKFLETSENELTIIPNLWDTAKGVLGGKLIAMQAYLQKIETFQINNLTLHLQALKDKQETKPRMSRRRKIIKVTADIIT